MPNAHKITETGPDHGGAGRQRMGINHRGDGIGGVVKAIDELKAERNQQRQSQQKEGQEAGDRHVGLFNVTDQVETGERETRDQQNKKQRFTEATAFAVEIRPAPDG